MLHQPMAVWVQVAYIYTTNPFKHIQIANDQLTKAMDDN